MENRKVTEFTLRDLLPIGLTFVLTGIVLAYGADIVGDVRADFTDTTSAEYNATGNTLNALTNLTGKLPTLATIAVAAVIIGVLVTAFAVRGR